ncbi:methylated-DNA--[protein]-cysteine S-methyltransferase [Vulcanisaeta distributa]|uniref:Methylated-DNA/protein-cysteinemethyltransferase n=1 Tax=Vulcanisaeta distributa (strain DSM 14429 / JCM 11212 / NBRC 100878 / IC-017) TaxID=572478 RepID=E1QS63_VULDI|nr:MGMT family protein [Vulcanisaeta distributa]ADN51895.1 methylated-DNA/protein-cysteinemethyltransferase [Vulcanisaeta distributa DSM 14429]
MRCITLLLKDVGALEVCIYGDKIREVKVRVGVDGIRESTVGHVSEVLLKYIMGLVEPREIIKYLELSPGLLGLAQVAMLSIPRGRVATYAQLAKLLNTSPRAVGKLASANRLPVIVPCHRVIKSDGSLGGYSAGDVNVKFKLLEMEGVKVVNGKVPRQYIVDDATLTKNFRELLNYASSNMLI